MLFIVAGNLVVVDVVDKFFRREEDFELNAVAEVERFAGFEDVRGFARRLECLKVTTIHFGASGNTVVVNFADGNFFKVRESRQLFFARSD